MCCHRGAAAGDPRSDRTGRNAENFRDLGVVERADVAEHDRGAELGRQRRERLVDAQPVCDAPGEVLRTRSRDRQLVQWDGSPPPPAQLVETGVGCHAVRPRRERRATVEAWQAAHECQERLLRGVERVCVVAGHAPAQPVHAVVVPA
jgi:hypothetical protein